MAPSAIETVVPDVSTLKLHSTIDNVQAKAQRTARGLFTPKFDADVKASKKGHAAAKVRHQFTPTLHRTTYCISLSPSLTPAVPQLPAHVEPRPKVPAPRAV